MDAAALNAITDVDTLRALVREKLDVIACHDAVITEKDASLARRDALIAKHQRTIHTRDLTIDKLTHELARLRRIQFAAKSEAMSVQQRELFNEAMTADIAAVEAEIEALQETDASAPRKPRKPVRRTLPADLPRVEVVHEPDQCDCSTCGQSLVKISDHVSEKLDVEPLKFFVRRDVYPQYTCRKCETVVAEPVAPAIIDRGMAAPGLLAQVAINKYADHLPLYRQEAIFARHGVELSRSTLAEWIGVIGLRLQPLVDALQRTLLTSPVVHADETPVRQLAPGTGKTQRAYLFAYAGHGWPSGAGAGGAGAARNRSAKPIIVFDYCPGRAGRYAASFLGDWRGALMVDDYAGYKKLFGPRITELGCWAHARRKFFDAHKASNSDEAQQALERIAKLYAIEAKLRDLDDAARTRERQRLSTPLLTDFKHWLHAQVPKALGNSGLSNAINYTLKRWAALARFADDGAWPIDNNPIERAIRPIAIGRKNWLFAGSETAGQRAAAIMSLIATAKANGVEPHAWLTDVLTRLPTTKDRDIATLLPLA